MLAAVGLSLLALVQRMAGTQLTRLGQIHATHDFVSLERYSGAETDPQILILRPAEPLFFANAERVLTLVSGQAAAEAVAVVILSLEESPDLDSTALDALMECDSKLTRLGRRLLLARTRDDIRDALRALGAEQLAGDGRCFHSVADAFASAILYNASAPPGTR
jgi:MFS superfamily sulfate permease-like transporter